MLDDVPPAHRTFAALACWLALAGCAVHPPRVAAAPASAAPVFVPAAVTPDASASPTVSAAATPTQLAPPPWSVTPSATGQPSAQPPTFNPSQSPTAWPTPTTPAPSPAPTVRPTPSRPVTAKAAGCRAPTGFVTKAPGSGKTVALTFDDGPAAADLKIAAILDRYQVKGTFFFTGSHAATHPGVVRRVAASGHQVAGHSWNHLYPRNVPWTIAYLTSQNTRTRAVLRKASGQRVCQFRPPGGFTTNVLATARQLRLTPVMWSHDTLDWRQPNVADQAATDRIVARATKVTKNRHPIVLMHSGAASRTGKRGNRLNTLAALPRIIEWYQAHGYRFVTMDGRS